MDRLSEYDYELPEEAIAQTPLQDRSGSKLLWLNKANGEIRHLQFSQVVDLLCPGDLLVLNNTRVTALRLFGEKATGGSVELLLMNEVQPGAFEALAKPGKRLKPGTLIFLEGVLSARIESDLEDAKKLIRFSEVDGLQEKIQAIGEVPLPPYIHERLQVRERYQTVYSGPGGSAAAPTAGLHFTEEILQTLEEKGVNVGYVTLNVGIDTFRPVQSENLDEHVMHGEVCELPNETAKLVNNCQGRIIAVGTTTVRTLETFATAKRTVEPGRQVSTLFIKPGYLFKVPDGMFTNFHLPRTTMLMMISAFSRRDWVLKAYAEALRNEYRFLSFGDSMLIL